MKNKHIAHQRLARKQAFSRMGLAVIATLLSGMAYATPPVSGARTSSSEGQQSLSTTGSQTVQSLNINGSDVSSVTDDVDVRIDTDGQSGT